MNIFFKTVEGRTIVVEVSGTDTLRAIRLQLSERSGVPIEELNIVYGGRLLDHSVYDDSPLSAIQVPYSYDGGMRSFFGLLSHLTLLHIVQKKFKLDSTSNSRDFTKPTLYWRVRQSDKFSDTNRYPLEEEGLDAITLCETLGDAFKTSKIRQENNKDNNKISIIEAIVIDNEQGLLWERAGEKYGNAHALFPKKDGEKVKVATVGYFKQSSPQFVTLNESPTTNAQKNKKIVDEVNLSIGQLLQPSNANIDSPASITSEEASKKLIVENFFKSSSNHFPENSFRYKIYEELIDPVSFEIMQDAVILPSGHTFSRESIKTLNKCPITRASFEQNTIKTNPRINEILVLLALSQDGKDDNFKEKLRKLIDDCKYDQKTSEPRDYKLESIMECLEKIENKENQIPVSDQNPLTTLKPKSDSSASPTLESAIPAKKFVETSSYQGYQPFLETLQGAGLTHLDQEGKNKIAQALQTYITRIESYTGNYRLNLSCEFFQGSQAVNREANYLLAKELIQSLNYPNSNLKRLREIFSDAHIKQQRDKIITDNNLSAKASGPYYNLGIRSKELNEAIDLARQLLSGESNTSSLDASSPSKI